MQTTITTETLHYSTSYLKSLHTKYPKDSRNGSSLGDALLWMARRAGDTKLVRPSALRGANAKRRAARAGGVARGAGVTRRAYTSNPKRLKRYLRSVPGRAVSWDHVALLLRRCFSYFDHFDFS